MSKKIVTIDLAILMSNVIPYYDTMASNGFQISGSFIENGPLKDMGIDQNSLSIILCNIILPLVKRIGMENVHVIYEQNDMVHFLNQNKDSEVYNIDFHSDCLDYMNEPMVGPHSWASYGLDNGLISEYHWIGADNSNMDEVTSYDIKRATIRALNPFTLLDAQELIISLSSNWFTNSQMPVINTIMQTIKIVGGKLPEVENYPNERQA